MLDDVQLALIEFVEQPAPKSVSFFPVQKNHDFMNFLGGIIFHDGADLVINGDSFINPLHFGEAEYAVATLGANTLFHVTKDECLPLTIEHLKNLKDMIGAIRSMFAYYEGTVELYAKMNNPTENDDKSAFAKSFEAVHGRPYNGTAHQALSINAERSGKILADARPFLNQLETIINPALMTFSPASAQGMDAKP